MHLSSTYAVHVLCCLGAWGGGGVHPITPKHRIPSPKKLRLGSGEGDPTAASSKGKDKGPIIDDMLSDGSGVGSNRISSPFSSVSEGCGAQDPDLPAPLSNKSKVGFENT